MIVTVIGLVEATDQMPNNNNRTITTGSVGDEDYLSAAERCSQFILLQITFDSVSDVVPIALENEHQ